MPLYVALPLEIAQPCFAQLLPQHFSRARYGRCSARHHVIQFLSYDAFPRPSRAAWHSPRPCLPCWSEFFRALTMLVTLVCVWQQRIRMQPLQQQHCCPTLNWMPRLALHARACKRTTHLRQQLVECGWPPARHSGYRCGSNSMQKSVVQERKTAPRATTCERGHTAKLPRGMEP